MLAPPHPSANVVWLLRTDEATSKTSYILSFLHTFSTAVVQIFTIFSSTASPISSTTFQHSAFQSTQTFHHSLLHAFAHITAFPPLTTHPLRSSLKATFSGCPVWILTELRALCHQSPGPWHCHCGQVCLPRLSGTVHSTITYSTYLVECLLANRNTQHTFTDRILVLESN